MAGGLGAHIITVEANEAESARTSKLVELLKPLSARTFESLEALGSLANEGTIAADAVTLIRLAGRAHTDVMAWLGARGRVSTEAAILGFADAIIAEPGQPPRATGVLAQAFISAIASSKQTYDMDGSGMIVGVTDETRAMAASLSRMGLKRIRIVDSDDRKTEQMVQLLRKRLFGVDIQAISRTSLTQVPSEASVAVNLVPSEDQVLLEDVSYLNFLKKGGVWIDWTDGITKLGYGDEVANAGAHIFNADLIRAWREALLLSVMPKVDEWTGQKPETLAPIARQIFETWSKDPS